MGIKNLLSFLKKKCPEINKNLDLCMLENKKICIDSPCLLYKFKFSNFSNNKNDWVNSLIYFFLMLLKNNIEPIVILEGKSPIQKLSTQIKRKKAKDTIINRNNYLNNLLTKFKEDNVVTVEIFEEWKKLKLKGDINIEEFEKKLKRRDCYTDKITKEDHDLFKETLKVFNFTIIQSENEAETLCAQLLSEKKVDYIFSTDSDVLAYKNINGFINSIDFVNKKFSFYDKSLILKSLNFSENKFIDFCILCGTDYNITPKKFGVISSFKELTKKNNIEEINFKEEDLINLNIQWIRDLFTYKNNNNNNKEVDVDFLCYDREKFEILKEKYNLNIYEYTSLIINDLIE